MNKACLIIVVLIIIIFILMSNCSKENFLSGGTIQQLFGKDNQDLYLNGKEIDPLIDGNFKLQYNQPTLMQNKIPRNKNTSVVEPQNNPYPSGTDFYDDGDTGSIFFEKDFGKINNEKTTIYPNQYTGEYYEPPLIDIAKPLNIY